MSSNKYVTTIKGEELLIEKTKKFNKLYYKIGNNTIENSGDCYLMDDGKYYREETGLLIYDHTIQKYVIKSFCKNLYHGLVNDSLQEGYFTSNIFPVRCQISKDKLEYFAISRDIFKNNLQYRERLSDGKFYHISLLKTYDFNRLMPPRQEIKNSLPYDSHGNMSEVVEHYNKAEVKIDNDVKKLTPLVGKYSFGLEFETTAGFVPQDLCLNNGLLALRDGSITGLEYVTVPLEGIKGIQTIKNICDILKERTTYDDKCSLHLHIGNIPRTPEFILAFILLTMEVQDNIFEMFPLYKKYNFGYKNKNYAAPYPSVELLRQLDPIINKSNLNKNFNVIFKFLSQGYDFSKYDFNLNNIQYHPSDPSGHHKWNVATRYFIHNLIPLIFGNKQTIEFRIHTPTYDFEKIMAFMSMNVALIKHAEETTFDILAGRRNFLTSILETYTQNVGYSIMDYYFNRVKILQRYNRENTIFDKEEDFSCHLLSPKLAEFKPYYSSYDETTTVDDGKYIGLNADLVKEIFQYTEKANTMKFNTKVVPPVTPKPSKKNVAKLDEYYQDTGASYTYEEYVKTSEADSVGF